MTDVRTAEEAIAYCRAQSARPAPTAPAGFCKRETREAYGVASDGTDDASSAWRATDKRIATTGSEAPRGALVWWTGGSNGHGHVAIADGSGGVWSVDIRRAGYWDHVPFARIGSSWPALRFAGVSADIDGVQVIAVPKPTAKTRIMLVRERYRLDRVVDLKLLDAAVAAGRTGAVKRCRDEIDAAMQALMREVNR